MDRRSFCAFCVGLLAGILFALCYLQYEQLLVVPTRAELEDPDYSTGGTSFYFVSLRKKRDDESSWRSKAKGGKEEGGEDGGVIEILGHVKNSESSGDEIERWLDQDKGIANKEKQDHTAPSLISKRDLHVDVGVHEDILARVSSPGFDTFQDADILKNEVKILCIVAIEDTYTSRYSKPLKDSWLKHCNQVLVVCSKTLNIPGAVQLDLKSGKLQTWSRTRASLIEAHDKFLNQFDWFVKVPHDGFVVIENLRLLLLLHQANIPGYVGHVFKSPASGEATFALSRHALKTIRPSLPTCSAGFFHGSDDANTLEACLSSVDVISAMDGRDPAGVFRFQMKVPKLHLPGGATARSQWNWRYHIHPGLQDPQCCREYVISFSNVERNELYLLEYSVYHLRPMGIGHYTCPTGTAPLVR